MKLLYKHIKKDFLAKKTMMAILSLFLIGTSFLHYFVHFSADKNLKIYRKLDQAALAENELKFINALEINETLIRNMTTAMLTVFLLILFLFLTNTIKKNQAKMGLLQSLGYTTLSIALQTSTLFSVVSWITALIGIITGYFGSSILMSAYKQTYMVDSISKGISFSSFIYPFAWGAYIYIVTVIAYMLSANKEVALLMKKADSSAAKPGFVEKVIGFFKLKGGYKYKLTLKNISELLLLITAIVTFGIMFVLSVSLLLSSREIMGSQREGREYSYITEYDEMKTIESEATEVTSSDNTDNLAYYLKLNAEINHNGEKISYNIIGIDSDNGLFSLYDKKHNKIDISNEQGVVLNPELAENYGIKVGDKLNIEIDGRAVELETTSIARNAGIKSMYVSKEKLAALMDVDNAVYNGTLSKASLDEGASTLYEDKMEALSRDQTSNKASAIINQSIGVATGCLLIFLAIFIGLSGNTESILIFDLLGYDNKKINSILLDPYLIVSNIIFFLSIPICIYAARKIQINTSFATGDYMPFQVSGFTIVYMFVILNIICFLVRAVFTRKIKKIIEGEKQAEYLSEW
ncbi:FtsX-like permease family protein [Butyrivibrio sp. M55]|uniref:FtsX-like permease family protein n=1 Tax=Butyrivibrio sp. M55 TaxID=1855323 RepID=UPI0008E72805|nr:AbrB/MazE/SpoVT family DNA-binding domain-containing protein [Butyrivibrio sp. M55]SFU45447.1 FtsX-like permease family protein [Butyrivibrio sp. M55]